MFTMLLIRLLLDMASLRATALPELLSDTGSFASGGVWILAAADSALTAVTGAVAGAATEGTGATTAATGVGAGGVSAALALLIMASTIAGGADAAVTGFLISPELARAAVGVAPVVVGAFFFELPNMVPKMLFFWDSAAPGAEAATGVAATAGTEEIVGALLGCETGATVAVAGTGAEGALGAATGAAAAGAAGATVTEAAAGFAAGAV